VSWPEVAQTLIGAGYTGSRIEAALEVLERTGDYNAARAVLDGERTEAERAAIEELLRT